MSKIFEALERAEQEQDRGVSDSRSYLKGNGDSNLPEELVVLGRPGSVAAEQFRFLRSRITRPMQGEVPRTILITSSLQGEGKTFTACNLAVTIAQGLDEHVLLVDADLRNPRLHRIFDVQDGSRGLSSHLVRDEPLENVLQKTGINKLTLLPAGQEAENPAEILSSERMKQFITEVKERYPDRLIILDSAPVQLAPETVALANEVDGVFLLVFRGHTPREAIQSSLERFKEDNFKGVIFNGYQGSSSYYRQYKSKSYGYGYGYGNSYQGRGTGKKPLQG